LADEHNGATPSHVWLPHRHRHRVLYGSPLVIPAKRRSASLMG
jgi:hypothetical protein